MRTLKTTWSILLATWVSATRWCLPAGATATYRTGTRLIEGVQAPDPRHNLTRYYGIPGSAPASGFDES